MPGPASAARDCEKGFQISRGNLHEGVAQMGLVDSATKYETGGPGVNLSLTSTSEVVDVANFHNVAPTRAIPYSLYERIYKTRAAAAAAASLEGRRREVRCKLPSYGYYFLPYEGRLGGCRIVGRPSALSGSKVTGLFRVIPGGLAAGANYSQGSYVVPLQGNPPGSARDELYSMYMYFEGGEGVGLARLTITNPTKLTYLRYCTSSTLGVGTKLRSLPLFNLADDKHKLSKQFSKVGSWITLSHERTYTNTYATLYLQVTPYAVTLFPRLPS
ncbi:hypothetical protein EV127DRAFT_491570 [Xylaria flabelliformis]|nr:hypothetical protein EV127DRAFT_491570 [Xylaria flabelliformis]